MYFCTYLVAKYMILPDFWITPNVDNPLGMLSWDPMASLWGGCGQTLINGAYEAHSVTLGSFNARLPCYRTFGG